MHNQNQFTQKLVDQQPNYEKKMVMDRKHKVMRPSLKKKKHTVKFI